MDQKNVITYTSNDCRECIHLLEQLDKWQIAYETRNVTEDHEYMEELQEMGIFGTPVTFIDDLQILGFQKSLLKYALGIGKYF